MAGRKDHLEWAEAHAGLAERLWEEGEKTERRWAAVVADYSLLHTVHAIAAELFNEHPEDHPQRWKLPRRIEPDRSTLAAQLQESFHLSRNARYMDQPPLLIGGITRRHLETLTARRRRYDDDHYQAVADAYDEAMREGIPPTKYVQEVLNLGTRTRAAKQVARARERGLLPPTEQRVPKGNTE